MSRFALLAVVLALTSIACGDDPTTTTPTPTVPTVTDTFLGTVSPNGGRTHQFATASSGTVQATITALTPDNTLVLGLALGTWSGSTCQIVLANDKASLGSIIVGASSSGGNLCVRLYDVGNLLEVATYQVDITHK